MLRDKLIISKGINELEVTYNSPKLSVIIPAYNSEKYIHKCLHSLVNQTLKDIEIIVVDDGSTDQTLKKADCFARNDSRIKVITQEHKLQGAARNKGINVATGKYIDFVSTMRRIHSSNFGKTNQKTEFKNYAAILRAKLKK